MVCSMTGYGYGYSLKENMGITIEIKSVNHRYLDLSFRLPKELQRWEELMRSRIREKVERGRLEIKLKVENMPEDMYSVQINYHLAQAYYEALQQVRDTLLMDDPVKLDQIISFPDVFMIQDRLEEDELISELIDDAIVKALKELISQKEKEGKNLADDLLDRCTNIEERMEKASEKAPIVVENYRHRLRQKIQELEGGVADEERILTECTIFAERCDITEEIVRMNSHLQLFRDSMNQAGAVGRKLDFILQEMVREINTIGSKANDNEISIWVVETKTDLEKMREQVQNIE